MAEKDSITLPRKDVELLASAATAMAAMWAMRQALGQPLGVAGATISVNGGPAQPLGEPDLAELQQAVIATRRALGWRK